MHFHNKFHTPSSNNSLATANKPKGNFRTSVMLSVYILQEHVYKISLFSNMCSHTPFQDTKLHVTRVTPNTVRPSAVLLLTMGKKKAWGNPFLKYISG
jgi:hypothetical protein